MKVAVVTPCYNSKDFVLDVLARVGKEVDFIVAVDDCCPQHTGQHIIDNSKDRRIHVEFNEVNQGVRAANPLIDLAESMSSLTRSIRGLAARV